MNFKDLQFSLGKLSSDVKTHIAKKNPLHKQDTKALSLWIFHERNDLATMKTLAYRKNETNKSFKEWTLHSHEAWNEYDELTDLQDIGDKLTTLLDKQAEIEKQYAARYQQYRHAIKSIREREEQLCDIREKRRTLQSRLVHLEKTNPKSPKRQEIEVELVTLDKETQFAEIELSDFKRFVLKEAFYIRFNAMVEYADKLKMIAGFGKYIVDLLDVEPTICPTSDTKTTPTPTTLPTTINTPLTKTTTTATEQLLLSSSSINTISTNNSNNQEPILRKQYTGESQTSLIINDCLLALEQYSPIEEDERPTLANQAIHDALHDNDATLLSEEDIQYYRKQGLGSLHYNEKDTLINKHTNKILETTTTVTSSTPISKSQEALLDRYNNNNDPSSSLPPPPAYSATITSNIPSKDEKKLPLPINNNSKVTTNVSSSSSKTKPSLNNNNNNNNNNNKSSLSENKITGGLVTANTITNQTQMKDDDNTNQKESCTGVQRTISVYKPDLKDDYPLMDYYRVYRNNPMPSNQPRSYTDFQQQYLQYQKK